MRVNNSSRPILPQDFEFLYKKIMNKQPNQSIHSKDYDTLWTWLGPVLRNLRFDAPIRELWLGGFFWSFLSNVDSENLLQSHPPGTFLLRFSNSSKGSLVITYKQSRAKIRQYLVQKQNSLVEFVGSQPSLLRFLKADISPNFDSISVTLVEKDVAFQKLNFKKKIIKDDKKENCYDFDMHNLQY